MDAIGSKSLPLVALAGAATGVVLSLQTRETLTRFGAKSMLPAVIIFSIVKESGPVITGLIVSGRVGAGIGAELGSMKASAYFVNVGRGATVDEAALAKALSEKRIAGAAVDVFAQEPPPAGHPLYALDNVIVSPHVSGFLPSYDDKCVALFAENLRRYLDGAPLLNLVDRVKGY